MNNYIEIDCLHNIFYVHHRFHQAMQIVTRFYWNILSNDGNIIFIKGARLACSLLHGPTYNFHCSTRRVKDNYFDFIMLEEIEDTRKQMLKQRQCSFQISHFSFTVVKRFFCIKYLNQKFDLYLCNLFHFDFSLFIPLRTHSIFGTSSESESHQNKK